MYLKLCFHLMPRTVIYVHVYIILYFPITYRNTLSIRMRMSLHKTVNRVVFSVNSNENTSPKRRVLMQMYRVVPITKIWIFLVATNLIV